MEQAPFDLNGSAEQVIGYYANMVYRLAFARTGSKYDADDIFQEVFLRYVKNIRHLQVKSTAKHGCCV